LANVDGVEEESGATEVAAISVVSVLCTRTCLITADRLSHSKPAQVLVVGSRFQVWTGAVPDPASHR
jgi:hypothetical protein